MVLKRFELMLFTRLALMFSCMSLASYFLVSPGYYAATLLFLLILAGMAVETVGFITKTNQQLSRFFSAVSYADFSQRFYLAEAASGFPELGKAISDVFDKFKQDRSRQEAEIRRLSAMLEHVPVPLVSVGINEKAALLNHAARQFFKDTTITKVSDLKMLGVDFFSQIRAMQPGDTRLVSCVIDGVSQGMALTVSEIAIAGKAERLISLQNIQNEIDEIQNEAWHDLVRVLRHEIMNSITPIVSLARTSQSMLDVLGAELPENSGAAAGLRDVEEAVATIARRAEGLMNFVSCYRKISQLPALERTRFRISDWIAGVTKMMAPNWQAKGIRLDIKVEPRDLEVVADRELLSQVLINLLRNCEYAVEGCAQGHVHIDARINRYGKVLLEVSDNGRGIPDDISAKIFVPFFTTRRDGSGVGLAISRQIMLAHKGNIRYMPSSRGGAAFVVSFA